MPKLTFLEKKFSWWWIRLVSRRFQTEDFFNIDNCREIIPVKFGEFCKEIRHVFLKNSWNCLFLEHFGMFSKLSKNFIPFLGKSQHRLISRWFRAIQNCKENRHSSGKFWIGMISNLILLIRQCRVPDSKRHTFPSFHISSVNLILIVLSFSYLLPFFPSYLLLFFSTSLLTFSSSLLLFCSSFPSDKSPG